MKKILSFLLLFSIAIGYSQNYVTVTDKCPLISFSETNLQNISANKADIKLTQTSSQVIVNIIGGGNQAIYWSVAQARAYGYSLDSLYNHILDILKVQCDTSGGGGVSQTLSLSSNTLSISGGNSVTLNYVDSIYYKRTIAQLRAAMAAKTLKKNAKYEATDFTTIYDQPDYDNIGDPKASVTTKTSAVEHLVFTANSDSTFDNYVSSIEYPTDIIQFDWSFTATEVMDAPAKGRISYRADNQGNILDYDFRTVLFKRYRNAGIYSSPFDNDSVSGEFPTFGNYDSTVGNVIIGYCAAYELQILPFEFLLPNNVFRQTAVKNRGDIIFLNTFLGDTNENFFGDGVISITTYAGFYYNYFGHGAENLTFLGNAENNYFGDETLNCLFGARCNDNSIWDKMTNFTAGEDFKRNIQYGEWSNSTVGDNFTDGVIYGLTDSITCGDNNFKIDLKSAVAITIGDNNSNIAFGGTKHIMPLNDFNGVKNVAFGGSIDGYNWVNGITPALHPEMYGTETKTIIKTPNGNVYTRYLNNSLTDAITIIN